MGKNTYTYTYSKDWVIEDNKPITSCPHLSQRKDILVHLELLLLAKKLQQEMGSYEWLFYAKHEEHDGIIMIHSPYIPKQSVSGARVEVDESVPSEYDVVVHSHHDMQLNNFSATDDEYINSNNAVSILWTNDKGFTDIVVKIKLPCGRYGLVKGELKGYYIDRPVERIKEDAERFFAENKDKIEKETYVYKAPVVTPYRYPNMYGSGYYGYYGSGSVNFRQESQKNEDEEDEDKDTGYLVEELCRGLDEEECRAVLKHYLDDDYW